jgi:translation initiation factor 2 subunit 3
MKVPRQPEINIGVVGHVDHGKTTLTEALTGEWTDRHSEEIKRGISIKLGYADAAFYKCPKCKPPKCYSVEKKCPHCESDTKLLRAVSFVDAPGHETLMATMISGAAMMNGGLLLIAANEQCPQPQTREHLMALEINGVKNIVIVQNKIDLVDKSGAIENYKRIVEFTKGTCAEGAPIIPVSAHHDANIDTLIGAIEEYMPTQKHDPSKPALMYVARSFDVNKPGGSPRDFVGGVIGGSLMQGTLRVGDEIEIKPGREVVKHGKGHRESIYTEITSLMAGGRRHDKVGPGGLIAIGTMLDPAMTKSDFLTGTMAGAVGTLPPTWDRITIDCYLMEYIIGTLEQMKVEGIRTRETLMVNAGTATSVGLVTSARKDELDLALKLPLCAAVGQRVALSRRVAGRWRLIGYGTIRG